MPEFIILRLYPSEPMDAADFRTVLNGLSISAFDLSFADAAAGALLGTAIGLADPHLPSTTNNHVTIANTSILQHYIDVQPLIGSKTRHLESVATAVIVVTPPATEYPTGTSYDLRLEISRGGMTLAAHRLHYNVPVETSGSTSTSQKVYFGMAASAYVSLPASGAGLDPTLAFVDLPPDGQPPAFDQLVAAINLVLGGDPGPPLDTLVDHSPLTPAQSRHVAAEIVWNRVAFPPPQPDPSLGLDPFGALYTVPPVDPDVTDEDIEKARPRFEAEQSGYYGTHDAEALRVAGFVFSASAAVAAEAMSISAERARFEFRLLTGAATPTTAQRGSVALVEGGGLTPTFVVPAAFFYALAAPMPSAVSPTQRYDMARLTLEPRLLAEFATAVDAGSVTATATPLTVAGGAINAAQAARRLSALGSAQKTLTDVPLVPPVETLVTDWLAYAGATTDIDPAFWTPEVAAHPAAYLELVLEAVTQNFAPLIAAIKGPPHNISDVAGLVAITDQEWRDFFLGPPPPPGAPPRLGLLPPFAAPGTPAERTEAFIRHLRTFFHVPFAPPTGTAPLLGLPPTFQLSVADAFAAFMAAYAIHAGVAFQFGTPPDNGAMIQALADVFPDDLNAQDWLEEALYTISELYELTDVGAGELHFSLMEALYARGFTSAEEVQALSPADFQFALSGSVAYPYANAIFAKAGGLVPAEPPQPGPFTPVNPDRSLVDCVPPPHLSPLGPVGYLHDLLQVSAESTCEEPLDPGNPECLGALLAGRRGPLGSLHATRANLETPVLVIDLVKESLEALTAGLPAATGGAAHDTASDTLAGHALATTGEVGGDPYAHDPQTLFAALPEHSSPATPVATPGTYDVLRGDFTHPDLPYPQGLDISRSYLEALGSSRFSAMRHFRKDITEFALDAEHEPAGFLRHVWRYPVRLEIALEFLRVSPEEYDLLYSHDIADVPTAGRLLLREVYGFPSDVVDGRPWSDVVREVPEFLARTGLTYCDFVDLWRARFVPFQRAVPERREDEPEEGDARTFPDCQPCCPDDLVIDFGQLDPLVALRKLAVFVRLWRRLRAVRCGALTFEQLSDVAEVLELFQGDAINPQFIRQLAAMVTLRELLCLPLADPQAAVPDDAIGADRTHLLALWVGPGAAFWGWARDRLMDGIEDNAEARRPELGAQPELAKLMADNLDALSRLAGFDPAVATDTWHAQPTSTLRFAEVLLKIYLSDFTVGEVLFLFSNDHLQGDDPFALPTPNESLDDPLELPDDEDQFGLWELRRHLLEVDVDDHAVAAWTWTRIASSLETQFDYEPVAPDDPLMALGEHFFPSVLEREGTPVPAERRRFSVPLPLAGTTPLMWNTPPDGPFRYDTVNERLWSQLPLRNAAVAERLSTLDPLNAAEQAAVRDLYFAPRSLLAPFALIFENFETAVDRLVHAGADEERFAIVQQEFARFHRRCEVIAEHLAENVAATATQDTPVSAGEAWRLLRSLWGDENKGVTAWEDDTGQPPGVTWPSPPTGGAFAALLGLVGTGLLGTFAVEGADPAWRETRGPLTAFGPGRNAWNAPVPTVIPSPAFTLTPAQLRFVTVRNGFALRDVDGEPLFGAQPFSVTWSGSLLVEEPGEYRFCAGAPTSDGEEPDFEAAEDHRWRLTLRRGQKSWVLLNHSWPGEEAPDRASAPLDLRRGTYEITIEVEHPEPSFARDEGICPRHTGFQLKYAGADTEDRLLAVPHRRLYRNRADTPLNEGLDLDGAARAYLRDRYTSSLRDIRRTYQRAFKAVLLAHRLGLSAETLPGDRQSELGYLLDHAEAFQGRSHPHTGPVAFGTHRAWLDPDLLPVGDPYRPPQPADDERVAPSARRQAALFDWWERLYDYTELRRETRKALDRPAWRLFYEAAERRPDEPVELVRHLGVDVRHAPLVLTYFDLPAAYVIATPDLESEAWAIRTWRGEVWLDAVQRCFHAAWIGDARPHRWVADDPTEGPDAGNENLTRYVRDGCFENGPPRRYEDVRALNDGLRLHARGALVAYLCGMDRVLLPFAPGTFARRAGDLSDLLLQDVEVGTCERASRIEEAVSAVQAFVQRARLGLEPDLVVTPAFVEAWDKRFTTFRDWQCCAERHVHRENWIDWDELRRARRVEAFRFLEEELREAKLTVAVPGGLEWWPGRRPPAYPSLTLLQNAEPSRIRLLTPGPVPEGLDLLGTPERDARPSWLAPVSRGLEFPAPHDNNNDDNDDDDNDGDDGPDIIEAPTRELAMVRGPGVFEFPEADVERLPFWIQAAIRLGARFVRVAAAGEPPASAAFEPCQDSDADGCCACCGWRHEPLVDEYYFWLQDAEVYDAVVQDADVGVSPPDETSDWHRPEELPGMLHWDPEPAVHLYWSRVHHGEFEPPRRSTDAVRTDPSLLPVGEWPELDFKGRAADSLRFEVTGGVAPIGYEDPTLPGFRYDLPTDSAVALPLVVAPPAPPAAAFPGGLDAYPYFAYVCPGAPVEPLSLFMVALTVAGALRAHCRFEAALKWYGLVLEPLHRDNTWAPCPDRGRPDDDGHGGEDDGGEDDGGEDDGGEDDGGEDDGEGEPVAVLAVVEGRARVAPALAPGRRRRGGDEACCPTSAADDDMARDRAVLLRYLETLLQWGDALMCQNSPEAFRQADVIFGTIARVLGDRPETVLAQDDPHPSVTVENFIARPAALNPRLMALYDRTADRLSLVHACLNGRRRRNGRPVTDMPYFGDDPRRDGWYAGGCECGECDDCCASCCDPYRFTARLAKAQEMAGDVRALGAQLLAAYEKGDAENLASLRATQERQLLDLTLEVRQNQWRDADWQVQALRKSKEAAQTRLRYHQNLIANGLNAGEIGYESLIGVSMASRTAGTVLEAIAQGIGLVPDFWIGVAGIAGTPLQFNQIPLGNKLAAGFATAARIMNALGEIAASGANLSLTVAGWDRREDEWRHQVDVLTIEIEQAERLILGAERRRDVALREINNHRRQIDNAVQVQNFLRDRFTSHDLYLFLQQETAALYYQSYELALCAARQAQRAFNYERGHTTRVFLPSDPWDSLREGLLAGERLQLAVRQMENAYLDENCREYELTKHISVRQQFPLPFLQLQATGQAELEIPEWMFDLDYSGHYMRRIKNVTLSIPCVVGPYTGIHCRLTLLSSQTRVDPRLREAPVDCCHAPCDCTCSSDPCCCCPPEASRYRLGVEDGRVVRSYAATEAIATSSGQNDSGLFELNFRDERYLPFEFAGAVSRWRIELPPETNFFDFDTLSDVVLHLNYTAREGGDVLRAAATADARCRLPGDGLRLIDVRRELPDAWASLRADRGGNWQRRFDLRLSTAMFPFVPSRRVRWIDRLQILVEAPCADPSANVVVRFVPGHHDHEGCECDCDRIDVHCIASREYPGLFWGVVDLPEDHLGPLGDRPAQVGTLEFPDALGEICDVHLVAGYCAEPWERCGHGVPCRCRAGGACCCGDRSTR